MSLRTWLILLWALLWASSASTVYAGNNVWTSLGPEGGTVVALAIDPTTPTTLYAGVRNFFAGGGGVFKRYHLKNPGLKAHALAGCHEGGKLA